ncbi:T9SS type A sorting domain-containing protein [Rasiella rasia]|uniref:T9SS type A sorting domain-containing protein n=1 Tax=Rasiella rasia TaxID=2744027 RepID=A0A6G6GM90_9FLAO|nr:PKD domain-containing protein [Rasiella rasia]QIE58811.1 T9SS type A sorting domain-containing protein [Rasiella rasia]
MKKLLFFLFVFVSILGNAQEYRYTNTLFPSAEKVADIVYGNAPAINFPYHDESNTTNADLVMDLYLPEGDDFELRPAVIFAHSGGFLNGNRNHEDMVAFCDSLARKGYVTATIDYRKSFYVLSNVPMHGTRAVYRAIQDGRAAVRYLRANAATYGIDPTKVYMGGSSAGAFIVLHDAYMNDPDEKPSETEAVSYNNAIFPFFHTGPDMGPVDVGLNLGENGQPDGILALWGAVQTPDLIKANDTTPIFMAHGTEDATVAFEVGPPFGFPPFPDVYGSNPINDKLETLNFTNKETYFVTGEGHEFHGTDNGNWPGTPNAFWDEIVNKSVNFLWLQHKPIADFISDTPGSLDVTFTDTSDGALAWWWDFGDGSTSTLQNPVHTYAADGTYNVKLYIENDIKSWDEISYEVTVEQVLGVSNLAEISFQVYPNPTQGTLFVKSNATINSIALYNTLGQLVFESKSSASIDISAVSEGIYYLQATGDFGTQQKKIIKK